MRQRHRPERAHVEPALTFRLSSGGRGARSLTLLAGALTRTPRGSRRELVTERRERLGWQQRRQVDLHEAELGGEGDVRQRLQRAARGWGLRERLNLDDLRTQRRWEVQERLVVVQQRAYLQAFRFRLDSRQQELDAGV